MDKFWWDKCSQDSWQLIQMALSSLDLYQLTCFIIFIQGQMLHGQMLTVKMYLRQLTTHTDGLAIQPSKFCWVLISNSGDMARYLLLNYRDPAAAKKKVNFAKPVVDFAASSRSWGSVGKLGLQSNWYAFLDVSPRGSAAVNMFSISNKSRTFS